LTEYKSKLEIMAEFYTYIERFKNTNPDYKVYTDKLKSEEESCLKNFKDNFKLSDRELENEVKICFKDRERFERYLTDYSNLYVENGVAFCEKKLAKENKTSPDDIYDCVKYYNNNIKEFEKNVLNKLQSVIYKFDFENL